MSVMVAIWSVTFVPGVIALLIGAFMKECPRRKQLLGVGGKLAGFGLLLGFLIDILMHLMGQ